MKHYTSFFISNFSFSLLFVVLFTASAFAETSSPPAAQATTEVVTSRAKVNGVDVSTTTAMQEGVPGRVTVNRVEVSARITAIDTENRKITLLSSEGDEKTVMVPPGGINFNQIQVGDLVKATLTEAVVIYLEQEGASVPDEFADGVTVIEPNAANPGGIVAETVKVTATVTAIDQSQRTATLRFDDGAVKTFPVRDDIDLSKRKEGEKVAFIVTETVALSVEKP